MKGVNKTYTHEELAALQLKLEHALKDIQRDNPSARPLPPMEENEARDMLIALFDTAATRTLTSTEAFLMGQLLSCYRMAVEARMMGRKGRYFVLSEAEINNLLR